MKILNAIILSFLPVVGIGQISIIPVNIIVESKQISLNDSVKVSGYVNKLILEPKSVMLDDFCRKINKERYLKWLKLYDTIIIEFLEDSIKKNSCCIDLLSLLDLPRNIKDSLLNEKNVSSLIKARLGDTIAINYTIRKYITEKNKDDEEYQSGALSKEVLNLLSLDSEKALNLIFNDFQSNRIIKKRESIIDGVYDDVFYTIPYAIIMALREKHYYEPIFQEKFICQFLEAESPQDVNPDIFEYYKLVESFILREYGYKVKINSPFLIAGWPAYGYYWSF